MKEACFVNPDELETLEQYGAALLSSMISIRTLEAFHIKAFQIGILDEDEEETGKTICWELRRLMGLYRQQVEQIMERTNLDEKAVIKNLSSQIPKRRTRRKRPNENQGNAPNS